jgi:hypothetical protein
MQLFEQGLKWNLYLLQLNHRLLKYLKHWVFFAENKSGAFKETYIKGGVK